ncbi:MAG: hypothetical protein EBS36_02655 [Actinobacteria bacterium]|nr:hypothetical protein [Actinomycetota bacterium]NBY14888.1 hypothetical protein [Actinomycetota bacterium]
MRFLIAVIDTASNTGSGDEIAAIDKFNDKLRENGHWIIACGINDPSTATVIDNRNGSGIQNAGPLLDSEEYMSGFWLINAQDLDEARQIAAQGSLACNRKVELRPLLG